VGGLQDPGRTRPDFSEELGLYYRVRSSREIDWIFQRNIQFLDDYLRGESVIAPNVRETVFARVGASPGLSLEQLFNSTSAVVSRDHIYSLIAAGEIYVDLSKESLTETSKALLFPSKMTAHSRVHTVRMTAAQDALVTPVQQTKVEARLARASESDLVVANERLRHLSDFLKKSQGGAPVPARTLRRWAAAYRSAESELGNGYLGLLPEPRRGNSTPKLPDETREIMNEFISSDYETLKQKTKYACWIALKLACDRRGAVAPSYQTFSLAVRRRPGFDQTIKRQGHRAAYALEAFYWNLEFTTPRHGDRPVEIGHIDHTELDVELVCSRTGRGLGRPWMTLLTDAFSRRILAIYLTFDPPSYRSCMMVLRECVRRHSRFPQITVVDGGREFQSTYFETLLARYESTKKTRPAAKPRFGSVCERLFGTANTQFIHNLKGNTQIASRVRQMSQSVL
jgi:putative transposase